MAQYLSTDLRVRVIGAVEAGMSRNAAARRFGVSIASAVRWMDAYLRTRRTAPKPRGATVVRGGSNAQADLLMQAIEAVPDITVAELRERLIAERDETFALSTIHDFYRRHGITYKKKAAHAGEQARADVAARSESHPQACHHRKDAGILVGGQHVGGLAHDLAPGDAKIGGELARSRSAGAARPRSW